MLENIRERLGLLEMFRYDNGKIVFSKKDDREGRWEGRNVGHVGKGMHGNVRESLGMLGNVGER